MGFCLLRFLFLVGPDLPCIPPTPFFEPDQLVRVYEQLIPRLVCETRHRNYARVSATTHNYNIHVVARRLGQVQTASRPRF